MEGKNKTVLRAIEVGSQNGKLCKGFQGNEVKQKIKKHDKEIRGMYAKMA